MAKRKPTKKPVTETPQLDRAEVERRAAEVLRSQGLPVGQLTTFSDEEIDRLAALYAEPLPRGLPDKFDGVLASRAQRRG